MIALFTEATLADHVAATINSAACVAIILLARFIMKAARR